MPLTLLFVFWASFFFHSALARVSKVKIQENLQLCPIKYRQKIDYFTKKSVTSSVRQVPPLIFWSTKFCQALPNFKGAVVLPRSRTNFCQAWNQGRFVNLHAMAVVWKETSIKKIWSLFLVGVFQSEARQNYFIFARQSNSEDGKFVPRDAAWRSLLRIQLLWFPRLRSSCISRSKYFQFVHPYVNRPNTHPYANPPITCTSYGTVGVEPIEGRKKQEYKQ